jgi:hypothetical protein
MRTGSRVPPSFLLLTTEIAQARSALFGAVPAIPRLRFELLRPVFFVFSKEVGQDKI